MNSLRFIDDQAHEGALNMAIDDFLALRAEDIAAPTVLRLYRWQRPTLSCGFHQNIMKRVNLEGCAQYQVQLARRPTGGRELLHENDLSFSITAAKCPEISATDYFKLASEVIKGGLQYLGLEASLMSRTEKVGELSKGPCLSASSQYEIICNGKKIVPIAQRVYQRSILIHGSITLKRWQIPTAKLLRVVNAEKLQEQIDKNAASLEGLAERPVKIGELAEGLRLSFEEVFKGKTKESDLSGAELAQATLEKEKWEIKV